MEPDKVIMNAELEIPPENSTRQPPEVPEPVAQIPLTPQQGVFPAPEESYALATTGLFTFLRF